MDGPLHRWVEQLPTEMRRQLIKFDLIDNCRLMSDTPIKQLVALFVTHLQAKARSPRYIRDCGRQLTRMMDECDVEYFSDIDRAKVEAFLTRLCNQGLGARTYNAYLKAAKSFCKWMVESGYASQSPLVSLRTINQEVDRRHERRALSDDETCRLLKAAAGGEETHGMSGPRAVSAVPTGHRNGLAGQRDPQSDQGVVRSRCLHRHPRGGLVQTKTQGRSDHQ